MLPKEEMWTRLVAENEALWDRAEPGGQGYTKEELIKELEEWRNGPFNCPWEYCELCYAIFPEMDARRCPCSWFQVEKGMTLKEIVVEFVARADYFLERLRENV